MAFDHDQIQQRLGLIPGICVETGLKTTGGRAESLYRLLEKYAEQHESDAMLIADALKAGDLGLAHRLTHSLKSVSGFLGLVGVQATVTRLDGALRGDPDYLVVEASLSDLKRENAFVCTAIINAITTSSSGLSPQQ